MELARDFFYDEVQDGFYVPGIMKRAWGAQLKILEEVDRICRKHGIIYCADGGTLLGAVRDGGYIPWDDDIDISMLPEEFEKFCRIIEEELPEELIFTYTGNNKNVCKFCGVVELATIQSDPVILKKYCEFPYPIFVDVFYLDELAKNPGDEEYRQKVLKLLYIVIKQGLTRGEKDKLFQKNLKNLEKILNFQINPEEAIAPQLCRIFHAVRQVFNGTGGKEVSFLQYHIVQKDKFVFTKVLYQKTRPISFCGLEIPAPEDYDAVLRLSFGDYHKKVKGMADHNYPFFRPWEKKFWGALKGDAAISILSSEDNQKRQGIKSLRALVMEEAEILRNLEEDIFRQFTAGDYLSSRAYIEKAQEEAIHFGNTIEQIKGEGTKSVSVLEQYCEALYSAYLALSEAINRGMSDTKFGKGEKRQYRERLEKKLTSPDYYLKKLRSALKKDFLYKVVFLPHMVKHFASFSPLIDALMEKGDVDCKIIPIPYLDRLGDGSISERHYEGADFPGGYEITDYHSYDFIKECPDAIVINSPYDEYNQVWTVEPFFYSREMKKFTKKLIYIPWFVTDEIDPKKEDDTPSFINMNYYVTVPGIFYADLTIVQSKEMKKAYLTKISKFTNSEIRKTMSKKISGAGSCLFGDKEGQGVKEVVKEFRHFLNKV